MDAVAPISMEHHRTSWRVWALVVLLALLLHALLLWLTPLWTSGTLPERIEVHPVDMRKLEEIRKQWRQREKSLLLDKNKNIPSASEAPPDARYMSDRNIRVEKEQRARDTNVIPKPPSAAHPNTGEQARPKTQAQPRSRLNLGALGVPMHLGQAAPPQEKQDPAPPSQSRGETVEPGGDQALLDKNLPMGSENLLNAQESVYYSFYARLYEEIGPAWQSRIRDVARVRQVPPGDYTTAVDVVMDRDGNLIEVRQVQSSGIAEFDDAVQKTWRKIAKFPNPPRDLLDRFGEIHTGWSFTVNVNETSGMMYMPPERNY